MPYKNKTSFFGIPIVGKGQRILAAEEKRKANIIENQIIGASKGIKCCVFEDGEYNLLEQVDGTYNVMLSCAGFNKSLVGLLNGGLVQTSSSIVWKNLVRGKVYYLYVKYTNRLYEDYEAFLTEASTHKKDLSVYSYLYLARVDLKGEQPILDSNPDEKLYSRDMAFHITDYTNPHGVKVFQERLVLMKELLFEKGLGDTKETISVINEDNVDQFLNKTAIIDIRSGGIGGIGGIIDDASEILSAQVVQLKVGLEIENLGEIAIGFYGKDSSILNKNEIVIYNSSDNHGIPIRVTIIYR